MCPEYISTQLPPKESHHLAELLTYPAGFWAILEMIWEMQDATEWCLQDVY